MHLEAGDEFSKSFLLEDTAHAARIQADTSTASEIVIQALSSVAVRGVSNAAFEHRKFGSVPDCSDECVEGLLKVCGICCNPMWDFLSTDW